MNASSTKKTLSILLSGAMLASTLQPAFAAPVAAPAVPDFVRAFTPPVRLGYVDSFYKGSTEKPVILIEDLHANYGVQKNIMGMLSFIQPRVTAGDRPMILGAEAAWGPIDTSYFRNITPKVRKAMCDIFLKEAEISATEHFAVTSEKPVQLVGVDSKEDYLLHRDLIRRSMAARLKLADKVDSLRASIAYAKNDAPKDLKKLWKLEEAFRKGDMDLNELARNLGVKSIADYGEAEAFLYRVKIRAAQKAGDKAAGLVALVKADQDMELLSRLFRQQLTLEEVEFVTAKLPEILAAVKAFQPEINMAEWEDAIKAALDYYAIALMRDKPLAEHAFELAQGNPDTSVVVVAGGFHTAGIKDILRRKNMSYVVISPIVQSQTMHDEALYISRMMGNHLTPQTLVGDIRQMAVTQTAGVTGAVETTGMKDVPAAEVQSVQGIVETTEEAVRKQNGDQEPPRATPGMALDRPEAFASSSFEFDVKDMKKMNRDIKISEFTGSLSEAEKRWYQVWRHVESFWKPYYPSDRSDYEAAPDFREYLSGLGINKVVVSVQKHKYDAQTEVRDGTLYVTFSNAVTNPWSIDFMNYQEAQQIRHLKSPAKQVEEDITKKSLERLIKNVLAKQSMLTEETMDSDTGFPVYGNRADAKILTDNVVQMAIFAALDDLGLGVVDGAGALNFKNAKKFANRVVERFWAQDAENQNVRATPAMSEPAYLTAISSFSEWLKSASETTQEEFNAKARELVSELSSMMPNLGNSQKKELKSNLARLREEATQRGFNAAA
jgi:hypothetical protein